MAAYQAVVSRSSASWRCARWRLSSAGPVSSAATWSNGWRTKDTSCGSRSATRRPHCSSSRWAASGRLCRCLRRWAARRRCAARSRALTWRSIAWASWPSRCRHVPRRAHRRAANASRPKRARPGCSAWCISRRSAPTRRRSRYAPRRRGRAGRAGGVSRATILRPSIVFGPEDAFFNRFAGLARFAGMPVIAGAPRFQPVYVGDVADAVMAALTEHATEGKVYELGGPDVMTFRDILRLILKLTQRSRPLFEIPRRWPACKPR